MLVGTEVVTKLWGSSTPPDTGTLAAPPEMFEVNTMAGFGMP
jgi:hypothetical protein